MIILDEEQKKRLIKDAGEHLLFGYKETEDELLQKKLAICVPYENGETLISCTRDCPYVVVAIEEDGVYEYPPISLDTLAYVMLGEDREV